LFAALNVLYGQAIAQSQQRHRHNECLQFLRQIHRETPEDQALHLACDNYMTHKHPTFQAWLETHPRFPIHFTPTSASWLNMVQRFFRRISTDRLERDIFRSVSELVAAIGEYVAMHNQNPKPFVWTAKANDILQKVIGANRLISSKKNEALH
jgi:transposase